MPTQYEILLQQQLQQPNALDDYSRGLLELGRFQAQRRFAQEQAERELKGRKEILAETQRAAAEIESAREKAALERTKEIQRSAAEIEAKREISAEKREDVRAKTRLEEARIDAETAIKKAAAATKEAHKQELVDYFGKLQIAKKDKETDDEYIARAQVELPTQLAKQLANLHNSIGTLAERRDELATKAASTYPIRLAKAAWDMSKSFIPEPYRGEMAKLEPLQRDTYIATLGPKGKTIADAYALGFDKARKVVYEVEAKDDQEIKNLNRLIAISQDDLSKRMADVTYSAAIPEFQRMIGILPSEVRTPGAGAAAGSGAYDWMGNPIATGKAEGLDFSRSALPGKPAAGSAGAPGNVGAAAPAGGGAPPPASDAPSMADVLSPAGSNIGEGYRRFGVVGAVGALPYSAGQALGSAIEAAPGLVDRYGGKAAQLIFGPEIVPTPRLFLDPKAKDEIVNPMGMDLYLNSLGIPQGFNVTAAGRRPTDAEIAEFRAKVPPRLPAGPLKRGVPPSQGEISAILDKITPVSPPMEIRGPARPPVAAPPMIDTGWSNREQQFLRPTPAYTGPSVRAATPAEVAMSEAAQAAELRKRIARHPKAAKFPVSPLRDKLSTMNLPELQTLYRQLGPEDIDVESEVVFPP